MVQYFSAAVPHLILKGLRNLGHGSESEVVTSGINEFAKVHSRSTFGPFGVTRIL